METFQLPPSLICPSCGGRAEAATNATGRTSPANGDFTICFYCTSINRYDVTTNSIRIVAFTDSELQDLAKNDPETFSFLGRAQRQINLMKKD